MSLSKIQETVRDRKPGVLQSVGSQRVHGDTTERLNNNNIFLVCIFYFKTYFYYIILFFIIYLFEALHFRCAFNVCVFLRYSGTYFCPKLRLFFHGCAESSDVHIDVTRNRW